MIVLVVGLGSIAKKHIKALFEINPNTKIFALRSSKIRKSEELPGVKNIYSYDEIAGLNPDFAIISNPTSEHYNTIERISTYNIPQFIEKPLFSNVGTETNELVKKIFEKNIPTYIACNLRHLHCIQEIKKQLEDKRINEVNVYCGSYLPDWRPGTDFRKTYSANAEMGGGVHIDLIHELDYVYWIYGVPLQQSKTYRSNSSLHISSVDYANYLWSYDKFAINIVLNYYRRDARRTMEIVTENETYLVDVLKNEIYRGDERIFSSEQRIADTYAAQLKFFIENVLSGKTQFNNIKEAYTILELCLREY